MIIDNFLKNLKDEETPTKYSYFEYCDIPENIKDNIERELDFDGYMMSCVNEEMSVEWLIKFYNYTENKNNKSIFLSIAADEYNHYLLYSDLVIKFFPEKNFQEEYKKYKEMIFNKVFLKEFLDQDNLNLSIFRHFMNENMFIIDLKYQYLNSRNLYIRDILKKIFSEESKHAALGKKIEIANNEEILKKFKKNLVIETRYILNKGIRYLDLQKCITEMNKYNLNINDYIHQIRKSKKSKDLTLGTVSSLYKFGKSLNCIEETTLENFLVKNNLIEKYKELL